MLIYRTTYRYEQDGEEHTGVITSHIWCRSHPGEEEAAARAWVRMRCDVKGQKLLEVLTCVCI